RPPSSPRFPYTTLFRSRMSSVDQLKYVEKYFQQRAGSGNGNLSTLEGVYTSVLYGSPKSDPSSTLWSAGSNEYKWNSGLDKNGRSEEHTSELQSRENLV